MDRKEHDELEKISDRNVDLLDRIGRLESKTGKRLLRLRHLMCLDAPTSIIEKERTLLDECIASYDELCAEYIKLEDYRASLGYESWIDLDRAVSNFEYMEALKCDE